MLVLPVFSTTGALLLWLLVTVVMPIAVGLVTKVTTNSSVKSLLLVLLSAINGFLSEWLAAGDTYDWVRGLLTAVVAYVVAVASHFGVWIPTGATAKAQASFVR